MANIKNNTVTFTATLLQFAENKDKTGWIYIDISADIAQQLKPGTKKSFRVKGSIDAHKIKGVSILPMGGGNFILAVNASIRKGIKKGKGAMITVTLTEDDQPYKLNKQLTTCLKDNKDAAGYFYSLPKGHQNYFSKWIDSAKTIQTQTDRLAKTITSLERKMDYGQMIRFYKKID
ncbi:MAG: YdeI/OmpD-associated family protein [Niabella sp.]